MTTVQNELPAGWKWVELGDVVSAISNGCSIKQNWDAEGYLVSRIETISSGEIDLDRTAWVELDQAQAKKYALVDGDILFSHINSLERIGNCASYTQDIGNLIHGMNLLRIQLDYSKVNSGFVKNYLCSSKAKTFYITQAKRAVNQASINIRNLKRMPIPLPPLEEQKRIAGILNKAEEIKKLREEADNKTDELIPAIFHEMFGCDTCTSNWFNGQIGQYGDIVSGVTKNNRLQDDSMVEAPYLRVANVQDGYLDLTEIKTILASPSNIQKYQLVKGDILLTEGGDNDKLGRGTIWSDEIPNCIHQNHVFRIRLDRTELLPEFISIYLSTPSAKAYFLKEAKQTTNLASINLKAVRELPVHIPSIELQERFVSKIGAIKELKSIQAKSKFELNTANSALLQMAFRGEL